MGRILIKTTPSLESSEYKLEKSNVYQHFIENIQVQDQKSAFSSLSSSSSKDQIPKKHCNISSSFKIEDILNSNQNYRNFNNENKNNLQFQKDFIDNDFILTGIDRQMSSRGYLLKENCDETSPKITCSKNINNNNNRKIVEKNSSSYFSSSSSSSSSSSYCSPTQSIYPSYSSLQNPSESLVVMPNPLINSADFLANKMPFFNNPFAALTNANCQKSMENNNHDPFMSQMEVHHQFFLKTNEQNKNYLAMEDLIKTTLSSKILIKDYEDKILDTENETKKKIVIIDEIAKKIDAFSESANNKSQSNSAKNNEKNQLKKDKKTENKIEKNGKSKKFSKKRDVEDDNHEDEDYDREGSICNCSDLTCSLSSILPIDQRNLPMCLRGASDEQLHLASLFNTLIHHKKCRRTRTVFSDGQLIGLEKRFENQKYLSTPDRIQLAESLGLSQLQVKTWYQNRRMKWKKKVLKDGSRNAPTKPKGRPKKNSIPSFSEIIKAAAEAANGKSTGSSTESIALNESVYSSSLDESRIESEDSCDEENNEICSSESDDDENNIL